MVLTFWIKSGSSFFSQNVEINVRKRIYIFFQFMVRVSRLMPKFWPWLERKNTSQQQQRQKKAFIGSTKKLFFKHQTKNRDRNFPSLIALGCLFMAVLDCILILCHMHQINGVMCKEGHRWTTADFDKAVNKAFKAEDTNISTMNTSL